MTTRRCRLGLEALEDRTVPAVFFVDRLTDDAPGVNGTGGEGSGDSGDLRYCIDQANRFSSGQDYISFNVSGTISLSAALADITESLVIDGNDSDSPGYAGGAADLVTIERSASAGNFGIFRVTDSFQNVDVSFFDLTVRNGFADNGGGFDIVGPFARGFVWNCVVTGNQATFYGGGAAAQQGATLDIQDSYFAGNSAGFGGAVANEDSGLYILRSTLAGNSASRGGAAFTISGAGSASTSLDNCTVDSNTSSGDGAISNYARTLPATTALVNCTVSYNIGAGLHAVYEEGYGYLTYRSCLFAANSGGDIRDVGGSGVGGSSIISYGFNVSDDSSGYLDDEGGTDFAGATSLNLGPLRFNGGYVGTIVTTRALLPGSQAIDRGSFSEATDARGISRPQGASDDAGAFEAQGDYVLTNLADNQAVQAGDSFPPMLVVLTDSGGHPVEGARIKFAISAGGATFSDGSTVYYAFTDADGVATSLGLVAGDTPSAGESFYYVDATTEDDLASASYYFYVFNDYPANLVLQVGGTTDGSIAEGKAVTVTGTFDDAGDNRAHTVYIDWDFDDSDLGPPALTTVITLGPGVFTFTATHVYTRATGLPASSPTARTIRVSVADASFYSVSDTREILVTDQVPVVNAGTDEFFNQGRAFTRQGSFSYEGAGSFTATVDYGDGTGVQALALNADRTFTLTHTYAQEGTYVVRVVVSDGRGQPGAAEFQADVMLPGVQDAAKGYVGPQGGSVTVSATGVTATLTTTGGRTSALIVARVPNGVADAQDGTFVVGSGTAIAAAYDVRTVNVGPNDIVVATFAYFNDDADLPTLYYFDRATGKQVVVPPSAYTVDPVARRITITFTGNSFIRVDQLKGTVFTITVPIANPFTPTTGPDIPVVAGVVPTITVPIPNTTATGFLLAQEGGQAASFFVSAASLDAVGSGTGTGPGGGTKTQGASFDTESASGAWAEVSDNEEAPLPGKASPRAAAAPATSRLPEAPKASISLPGVTLTPPQPRRFDLGSMPSGPGSEEEEQEEASADVESLDAVFAGMGEEPACGAALLMMVPLLARPTLPRRRRAAS